MRESCVGILVANLLVSVAFGDGAVRGYQPMHRNKIFVCVVFIFYAWARAAYGIARVTPRQLNARGPDGGDQVVVGARDDQRTGENSVGVKLLNAGGGQFHASTGAGADSLEDAFAIGMDIEGHAL